MVEQLLNHIDRHALGKTTDKILLAVSGGVDSMVMLHAMHAAGFRVGVAHCNFQLRGPASDLDESFVQETCRQMAIPFFSTRFDTAAHAAQKGISIQMAPRELRYNFFEHVRRDHAYHAVATAHHFNDSIETVFLNLVRGTGMDGLAGITPRQGFVIRPLLFATRAMIEDYAGRHALAWREDSSNATDNYHRNFIRRQVLPRLEELNPNFETTFRETQARLAGAAGFAAAFIDAFRNRAVEVTGAKTVISIRHIQQSEAPAVLLWELVKQYGFNYDQCTKVVQPHQPGKLFFSPSHQLLIDRSEYIIERSDKAGFAPVSVDRLVPAVRQSGLVLTFREVENFEFELRHDAAIAQLDGGILQYPILWRTWKAGDYFTPLGMKQEKKLSDFLIDLRIPFNDKADVTVLESGGQIVWVVGLRISERFKVTPRTKTVLIVEQKPAPPGKK